MGFIYFGSVASKRQSWNGTGVLEAAFGQFAIYVTVENILIFSHQKPFLSPKSQLCSKNTGAFPNWWSDTLCQAGRLGACDGGMMWEGKPFWSGTMPSPIIQPSSPSIHLSIHPSIHSSIAPCLPIWLRPSLRPVLLGLPPSWQLARWAADTYPGIRGFTDTIDQTSTSFSKEMNV